MSKVDQFESVFKSAAKTIYAHEAVSVSNILVLTDLAAEEAEAFGDRVRTFLDVLRAGPGEERWQVVAGDAFDSVRALLDLVQGAAPDLVVTYRSLHSQAWPWTYTLGRYVDVLAQELPIPVLILPNPHAELQAPDTFPGGKPVYEKRRTVAVMALTDHLTGQHRLVNFAAHFTAPSGRLVLAHVEDGGVFDRYMEVISKIPSIDTDHARETIRAQLLKEPRDYVRSCADVLRHAGLPLTVEEVVAMGHLVSEVRRLTDEHAIDLLVLNTKDEDQLAMHGLAYPLVVELRHLPILML